MFLVRMMFEAGPVSYAAMGPVPLTQEAIGWYQCNSGVRLSPWEVLALRSLSAAWLAEADAAKKEGAPPPYVDPGADAVYRRERLPQFIRSALREGISENARRGS